MPYGIAKKYGGDSAGNDARMEKVVAAIMRENPHMPKGHAIAIAKAQRARARSKR